VVIDLGLAEATIPELDDRLGTVVQDTNFYEVGAAPPAGAVLAPMRGAHVRLPRAPTTVAEHLDILCRRAEPNAASRLAAFTDSVLAFWPAGVMRDLDDGKNLEHCMEHRECRDVVLAHPKLADYGGHGGRVAELLNADPGHAVRIVFLSELTTPQAAFFDPGSMLSGLDIHGNVRHQSPFAMKRGCMWALRAGEAAPVYGPAGRGYAERAERDAAAASALAFAVANVVGGGALSAHNTSVYAGMLCASQQPVPVITVHIGRALLDIVEQRIGAGATALVVANAAYTGVGVDVKQKLAGAEDGDHTGTWFASGVPHVGDVCVALFLGLALKQLGDVYEFAAAHPYTRRGVKSIVSVSQGGHAYHNGRADVPRGGGGGAGGGGHGGPAVAAAAADAGAFDDDAEEGWDGHVF